MHALIIFISYGQHVMIYLMISNSLTSIMRIVRTFLREKLFTMMACVSCQTQSRFSKCSRNVFIVICKINDRKNIYFSDLDWNKLPLTYYTNGAQLSFDIIQYIGYNYWVRDDFDRSFLSIYEICHLIKTASFLLRYKLIYACFRS